MKRILVADDHPQMRGLLRASLQAAGYTVDLAGNGREALERLREPGPALVLLDMQMPELDGAGVLRAMRADAEIAAVPVIAITAYATAESRAEALALGCKAYLTKPVGRKLLLDEIAKWLAGKEVGGGGSGGGRGTLAPAHPSNKRDWQN